MRRVTSGCASMRAERLELRLAELAGGDERGRGTALERATIATGPRSFTTGKRPPPDVDGELGRSLSSQRPRNCSKRRERSAPRV